MNFEELVTMYQPLVLVGCLVVGYLIKHSFDFIPNKYIPVILSVLGAVINCIAFGLSLEHVIYGASMGLASTGMHQAFKNFIEGSKESV